MYLHWTVLVVWAVILLNAISNPVLSLVGLFCYTGVLLIHEWGHLIAAQRLNCRVYSIELYPFFRFIRFEIPWSHVDHCVIAWGGVVAQAVIAIPLLIWLAVFGYSSVQPANAVIVILGIFSLFVAAFNLLPIRNLDGNVAWGLLPALMHRSRLQSKESARYKSSR